jgi:hypothetical protein
VTTVGPVLVAALAGVRRPGRCAAACPHSYERRVRPDVVYRACAPTPPPVSIARGAARGATAPTPQGATPAGHRLGLRWPAAVAGRTDAQTAGGHSCYWRLPAAGPSCPGGGSCRPGWYRSVTGRACGWWGGASAAAPRGRAGRLSPSWLAASRSVRRLPAALTRHSRSSSAANGPVPCSRYSRSPWL